MIVTYIEQIQDEFISEIHWTGWAQFPYSETVSLKQDYPSL